MIKPLYVPDPTRVREARISAFADLLRERHGADVSDFDALHRFSVTHMEAFWAAVWDFCGVIASERGERVLARPDAMPGAQFFPDARLNFARNLLRKSTDEPAIYFRAEDKAERVLTWRELHSEVSRLQQALRAEGVGPGDRCAGFVPNAPQTVIAMLAVASLGGVWTSCSPDFGVSGVLDRFGQTAPKVLFTADGYWYGGKSHDSLARVREFLPRLPSVERVVVLPLLSDAPELDGLPRAITLPDLCRPFEATELVFEELPFNSPLYIMYSSGTTGKPKCIVHGIGGTLLQHLKEHQLHCDVRPGDRVFYFTTCGWMMWNWLVSALASEAAIVLYDGSPFRPAPSVLFDYADAAGITLFGTSAKFIDALAKEGIEPRETHDLGTVRAILSTGSPLVPKSFDYVYESIKADVQLASISGGTDIIGCFVGGNPLVPVYRGEIQGRMLGMAIEAFDDDASPVPVGGQGELVCTRPFPSMPLGFFDDADGARYRAAYFERFPGIWCHGDIIAFTQTGGAVIYGRSDATLNPGGVRIGTAELYQVVERFDEVAEALAIGQQWAGDTRIVLFVRLREGHVLDDAMRLRLKRSIREGCTPRHVPAKILQVADIPRTKSGKITELAVRDVVHGRSVKNRAALQNPEALDLYAGLEELSRD